MNRNLAGVVVLLLSCAALVAGISRVSRAGATTAPPTVRVGTFDPQALVVAYYRSPQHGQIMAKLHEEHRQAKADGNEARVKELEKQGAAKQELAHQQMSGKAPIDNIIEFLKPTMPDIARDARVQLVVSSADAVLYRSDDAEIVDITDTILAELHADAKTLEVIKEVKAKGWK